MNPKLKTSRHNLLALSLGLRPLRNASLCQTSSFDMTSRFAATGLLPRAYKHRQKLLRVRRCFYHSHKLTSRPSYSPTESAILAAALRWVPEQGFTPAALVAGVQDAGHPEVSLGLLTRGPFNLVHFHLMKQRQELTRSATALDVTHGASLRARNIILRRLMANRPIISHWSQVRFFVECLTIWHDSNPSADTHHEIDENDNGSSVCI